MNPIPDFSYFAVDGFIDYMKGRPAKSGSLILHNGKFEERDVALSDLMLEIRSGFDESYHIKNMKRKQGVLKL